MDVESRKGAKGPKGYVPMAEKKTNNVGYCLPGFRTGLVSQVNGLYSPQAQRPMWREMSARGNAQLSVRGFTLLLTVIFGKCPV